jgi:hypothetical protein
MKKIIICLMFLSSTAMAATTGAITLSGVIPKIVSIVVSPVSGYSALDLTTTTNNLTVANVQELSNVQTGYTVTLSSVNSGLLKNGSVQSVGYTAKYNGVACSLTTQPVTITSTSSATGVINVTKPFTVSYTGTPAASLVDGTYSDTLTFTISAN